MSLMMVTASNFRMLLLFDPSPTFVRSPTTSTITYAHWHPRGNCQGDAFGTRLQLGAGGAAGGPPSSAPTISHEASSAAWAGVGATACHKLGTRTVGAVPAGVPFGV